jgi:hypothetical protein
VDPEPLSQTQDLKHWAFISYSHTDAQWGDCLHKNIECYRMPRSLTGKTRAHVVERAVKGERIHSRDAEKTEQNMEEIAPGLHTSSSLGENSLAKNVLTVNEP